jgi:hypothetical protein
MVQAIQDQWAIVIAVIVVIALGAWLLASRARRSRRA